MVPAHERILIIGCGYLGTRVAARLRSQGCEVVGTTRSQERAAELERLEIEPAILNLADVESSEVLSRAFDAVVYAVAGGRGGDPRPAYVDGPRACFERLHQVTDAPKRFLFVSSTGVYGQSSGEILDERSEARPTSEPHLSIRSTEEWILARQGIVVRLGGLYGPGRSPVDWLRRPSFRANLTKGRSAWMNWIHIDDAADVVAGAAMVGAQGAIYLGVDGHPVRRADLYDLAAKLAGVEPPTLGEDPEDLGKRLDGSWTLAQLGVTPEYPDYRVALQSIAGESHDRSSDPGSRS